MFISSKKIKNTLTLSCLLWAATFTSLAAEAPVALGRAGNFAVLAGSTVTSTGATIVNGNLGVSPGTAVTGFPPGAVVGTIHAGDSVAADAQTDLTIAYNDAAGRSTAPVSVSGNLGGLTLTPGLFKSTSSLEISAGDLTLDGQGDPNAVFIFQIASTFITTSGRQVILAGGAQAANVFWQVGSSATIGTTSVVKGNILADQSITLQTGATLDGKALARIAAVTMDSNLINGGGGSNSNQPPVCALQISCAFTLAGQTNSYVIALNKSTACVVMDGSSTSNQASPQFSWLIDGTNVQSGARITNCLAIGCHSILLKVTDAQGGVAVCEPDLCVITAADAIEHLICLVERADLSTKHKGHKHKTHFDKRHFLKSLKAAASSFNRGSLKAGMNQLKVFRHTVQTQLCRTHPAIAALLMDTARTIADAVHCSARMSLAGRDCPKAGDDDDDQHHDGDDDDDRQRKDNDDDHDRRDKK
jgi:Ice-binding-like